MRLSRVTIALVWVVVITVALFSSGSTPVVEAKNTTPPITDSTVVVPDGGGGKSDGPKKSTYCNNEPAEFRNVQSHNEGYYLYSDGSRSYTYVVGTFSVWVGNKKIEGQTEGAVPTHVEVRVWCTDGTDESNVNYIWVPLITPEAVAEQSGLLAQVVANLEEPTITFVDADIENGWLYVNVDHHLSLQPPAPIQKSATASNEWFGSITAWISAEPTTLYIDIQDEAGEAYSETCDLAQATSDTGCRIRFDHSSSIAANGVFEVEARLWWTVSSNSGKYDGAGPFETSSKTEIAVAEAMAVTPPG